ncbi:hypothetical protein MN116_003491 [Schistosoma mekongi]|uniref:L-serine ammonia-lyase n=1 Tax=Schistosoma mekongi TaxID=38744 RepID=A0AAE1ZIC0_SCHME|nr:hypothetical protein MN116_003491 [Schistosoma mekongi]
MHVNGCMGSNLLDVFPSIPFQDTNNSSSTGPILNINGPNTNSTDTVSRLKFLGGNENTLLNEDRSRTNLIINYLPQSYDQNDLQHLFERVGPIRQCKLIRDKNTGGSLCYGFVDFVNPQHAALAIQTYHGYETEQKRLRVAYASSEWTEPDLLRLFSNFGAVVVIRLLAPQVPDSPPGQKPRLSPALNGASSDMSSESADGKFTSKHTLRGLANAQNHLPWPFTSQRTVLSSLSETGRSNEINPNTLAIGVCRRLSVKSPLIPSPILSSLLSQRGCQINVWLKLENIQPTGSFKIRGVENVVRKWVAAGRQKVLNGPERLSGFAQFSPVAIEYIFWHPTPSNHTNQKHTLRGLANAQNHLPWPFTSQRTVLSSLSETGRSNEINPNTLAIGVCRRLSVKSPLIPSPILSSLLSQRGCQINVWLKLENIQPTGSFKIRGVENVVRKWVAAGVNHIVCPTPESGQLAIIPRGSTVATSLSALVLAQRTWNLAQCHSTGAVTCTDAEAVDGVKRFLDDHGMLVDPACGAALSTLIDWENQMSPFAPEQIAASVLPPLSSSYITHLSPRPTCQEMSKSATITHYATAVDHEESRNGTPTPGTPRSLCTILSRTAVFRSDPTENQMSVCNNVEVENVSECAGSLNPHDLVNFSKLLASSEAEGEEGGLRE